MIDKCSNSTQTGSLLAMLIAAVLSVAALAMVGAPAQARDLTPVSFRTGIYYSGATLPIIAGVKLGIFEKHGLDVKLGQGKGSATTIQTVANGSDDMGYADAATMLQSVSRGVPVRMVAGMVEKSPLAIFTFPDSGIDSPKDLEGKTGGYTPGSAAERLFPAYAKAAGFNARAVTFYNVDIPTRTQIFMAGKTDFTFGLLNVSLPNLKRACDCKIKVLPYSDVGIRALSSGIIVGDAFLNKHPDTVKKFLTALAEAVQFSNQHTDKAVQAFLEFAPHTQLAPDQIAEQWHKSAALHHTDQNEDAPFGCMATKDWGSTLALMEEYGGVRAGSVTVADAATNAFLPEQCPAHLQEDD